MQHSVAAARRNLHYILALEVLFTYMVSFRTQLVRFDK